MSPSTAEHAVARPEPVDQARRRLSIGRGAALAVLAVIAVCFLLAVADDLNAPFGDSYEGRNGGVWGAGSQAILDDGPLASALGARHDGGLVYARHPPLIYPLTATAEWLGGSRPAVTRVPSVLAAVATLALLYVMLRTIGPRRLSAIVGVGVASSTAMFTVYGPMPDTPMLGLPVGLALVVVWLRRRQGRAFSRRTEFALAAAAALTAWQAVFVALLLAAIEAVRAEPAQAGWQPARRIRAAAPLIAGTALGLALTLAWVVWATGGPGHLVDALTERSGAEGGVDSVRIMSAQLTALIDLFGLAVLGLLAAVVSIRTPRYRPAALILLTSVFGYAALTPTAAAVHDYWLYWAIAPVALGWAYIAELTFDASRERGDDRAFVGVVLGAVAIMAVGWSISSTAGQAFEAGIPAGRLVESVELPADQERLPTVGVINQFAAWIPLATGADTGALADRAELATMAADTPDHLLLASTWCGPDDDGLCVALTGGGGTRTEHDYVLLTAQAALERVSNPVEPTGTDRLEPTL